MKRGSVLALLLVVAVLTACAVTQEYQIVGHKVGSDQEQSDSQACAKQAGLGQATNVIFSGLRWDYLSEQG